MSNFPKISVVTIVRNDAEGFLITARSVLEQDYPNLEWIVIDGLSTDGTSDYVRSLTPRISKLKIEKDTGIYNAMNKGIEMVTGSWVFFMNADDVFFNKNVVSTYVKNMNIKDDFIYSDVVRREDGRIHCYRSADYYWLGMICDHQTICGKTEIYRNLLYDESYKINGDFDLLSRARISGRNFRKLPWLCGARKPFSKGASSGFFDRQRERIQVIKKYFYDRPWSDLLLKEFSQAKNNNLINAEEYEILNSLIKEKCEWR